MTNRSEPLITTDTLALGEHIGRYIVKGHIGQGGMGTILHVWDEQLERSFALKLLPAAHALDHEHRQRFLREVDVLARQHHPHLVSVIEAGEHKGTPYYVMDLVVGKSLQEVVDQQGSLPESEVLRIMRQVGQGLAHLHRQGVIHRDVKPSNILLRDDGFAILSDFGLARDLNQDSQLTQSGLSMGTPAFMAPEQVRAESELLGPATDVYQLGITATCLLTGQAPHAGKSAHEQMMAIVEGQTPSLAGARVSNPFKAIVRKATNLHAQKRYKNAEAFVQDIERIRAGEWAIARGRNPVARSLHTIKRYIAPISVIAAGLAVIASLVLMELGARGYADDSGYGNRRSYSALAPSTSLTLTPIGGSIGDDSARQILTRDERSPLVALVSNHEPEEHSREESHPSFGWGDYQAVFEFGKAQPANATTHCFIGSSRLTPEQGLYITVNWQDHRFVLKDHGKELINLKLDDSSDQLLRITTTRQGERLQVQLSQTGTPLRTIDLRSYPFPAPKTHTTSLGLGLIADTQSLELGEISYQQLPEQSSRPTLLLCSGAYQEALLRIEALLREQDLSALERHEYQLRRGFCYAALGVQTLEQQSLPAETSRMGKEFLTKAQSAFENASLANNRDIAFYASLATLELNAHQYRLGIRNDLLAPSTLRTIFSASQGSDDKRSQVVCLLRELSLKLAGHPHDPRQSASTEALAREMIRESQWEPYLCLRAYEDLIALSTPERALELRWQAANRPTLRTEAQRYTLLVTPLIDHVLAAPTPLDQTPLHDWHDIAEIADRVSALSFETVTEELAHALSTFMAIRFFDALGGESDNNELESLRTLVTLHGTEGTQSAQIQHHLAWFELVANAFSSRDRERANTACLEALAFTDLESVPSAMRGGLPAGLWRELLVARSHELQANINDALTRYERIVMEWNTQVPNLTWVFEWISLRRAHLASQK